jgi:hypothetical protein
MSRYFRRGSERECPRRNAHQPGCAREPVPDTLSITSCRPHAEEWNDPANMQWPTVARGKQKTSGRGLDVDRGATCANEQLQKVP